MQAGDRRRQRRPQRRERQVRTDDDRDPVTRLLVLRHREVDDRAKILAELSVLRVLDEADDPEAAYDPRGGLLVDLNDAADRILSGKGRAGERLGDDGDQLGAPGVAILEVPA